MSEFEDFYSPEESDTEIPYQDIRKYKMAETESEKKRIRIAKGQCKATVTKMEKYLRNDTMSFTIEDLSVRQKMMTETYTKYQQLSVDYQMLDEADYEDNTEDRIVELLSLIEKKKNLLKNYGNSASSLQKVHHEAYTAKLPALDMPVFDGKDIVTYKPFIDMFSAMVDKDDRLSNIHKLCFLKKYIKGEPLQLIDSLPVTGESYTSALQLLKKRYDNPALLINNHVGSILDLPIVTRGTAQQLRELVAKVRQHITALNNLQQPTEQWGVILCCILMRKLDSFTIRLYHSDRDASVLATVDNLLEFLDKRAASLEASFSVGERMNAKVKPSVNLVNTSESNKNNCILCCQQHKLFKCPKFNLMSPSSRLEFIQNKNLCKICLASHVKKCRYNFKCFHCNSTLHNSLIHVSENKSNSNAIVQGNEPALESESQRINLHARQSFSTDILLPTAKVLVKDAYNNEYAVRALLDSGSQISFCTTSLANKLQIDQFNLHKNIVTLGDSSQKINKAINLTIYSMIEKYKINVTCSIIDKITTNLPQRQFNIHDLFIPKNIILADDSCNVPGEISLLLAADVFFRVLKDGKVEGGPEDPILINTHFGYIISSNIHSSIHLKGKTFHTLSNPELDNYVKQFWEVEKVPEIYMESIPEHEYSEKIFQESVILENNTFIVKPPLKVRLQDIDSSNSFIIALQRFYNLEKRFARDPEYFALYKEFINEYLRLGHAKMLDVENCPPEEQPLCFLPHHAVLRPDKQTNKLRVVFDGSAKMANGQSLNDMLCNGPVVQNSLFDNLLLFRTYKYTLQCDVRHMYRMIKIHREYRVLQNILWRSNEVIQCLQLQTITYGLTSSAFLATRCLIELANRYKAEFPVASEAIIRNSYIDDIQGGSNTIQGLFTLKKELIDLMQLANFNLHKWSSNNSDILQDIPKEKLGLETKEITQDKSYIIKILGLPFDAQNDVFKVSGRVITSATVPTKRNILSSISRLFDPLGFAGPVTLKAKLLLQQVCLSNSKWDAILPDNLFKIWESFYDKVINMPDINIQRYLEMADADEIQLIGYCDASANAFGCCVYIKVKVKNKINVHLLCSKSRVAPLNSKLTIPRLELNGALLLAKLIFHVATVLNILNINLFCDSKIVLGWLASLTVKVPAYIGNRVKEINRLTKGMLWYYTPGSFNPADILSRGADPLEIIDNNLWKHGPDYLRVSNNYNFYLSQIENPLVENSVINTVIDNEPLMTFFINYSSLFKMKRIMAHILRFSKRVKGLPVSKGEFSVKELKEALLMIIRAIQIHYFAEEFKYILMNKDLKSNLRQLNPFIDGNGLIRVGGRLGNAVMSYSKKFPIILPKGCHVTRLIIRNEHLSLMHGGLKLVLGSLGQNYHIINSIREVKSVIHKCIICCRHRADCSRQLMGSLPSDRVNPIRVFEKVGLDYCGPFGVKQSTRRNSLISKGYIVVFVCFVSKAVHLELVSDVATDTFIAALKRFVSRRGYPSDIYCDNASTFKGANNKLKSVYDLVNKGEFQNAMYSFILRKNIQFHFIPAYSPNHGGLWESAVKSAKFHFKRISSTKIFTYEQFSTIIAEIEAILNSRPLTPLMQDTSDYSYLTPGHFLIGAPLTSLPQEDITHVPSNRLRFWRSCEQIRQHFWKAWFNDYLSFINKRTKWQKTFPNLKEGMVVLLKGLNTPPLYWPLGRIHKVHLGKDDKVRVIEVQTADKKMHTRAVSKVVVLPIDC